MQTKIKIPDYGNLICRWLEEGAPDMRKVNEAPSVGQILLNGDEEECVVQDVAK